MGAGYSASSSASSGVNASNAFNSGGFKVNYGTEASIPVWVWAGALLLGALFIFKRGR